VTGGTATVVRTNGQHRETVQIDANGSYAAEVPAGTHQTIVDAPGSPTRVREDITAEPGTPASSDITLEDSGMLTGVFDNPSGTAAAKIPVQISGGDEAYYTRTNSTGGYSVSVSPGSYTVSPLGTSAGNSSQNVSVAPGETVATSATLQPRSVDPTASLGIVDLLAILPFYLSGVLVVDTRFLRAMRLFRVVRLLKIARYSETMRSFSTVLRSQKEKLVVAAAMNLILLVLSSSVMYQLEHEAQPELFSSIPATLWWGAMTLTTVGYGDIYPVTRLGQVAGALIAVFGIGLFALPASILATGFIEDSQSDTQASCPHCGESLRDH
jgi:Ion transport protein.